MQLELIEGDFVIAQLPAYAPVPNWAAGDEFVSISRTCDELSIVCRNAPADVPCRRGWRCLKVRGPLDFSLIGVLASLTDALARAGVPVFVISTFDTDYLLIENGHLDRALAALAAAGHEVR